MLGEHSSRKHIYRRTFSMSHGVIIDDGIETESEYSILLSLSQDGV